MKKGHWRISPEEDARRYNLWKQGYTDTQIARILGLHPGSIQGWRMARGLPSNDGPVNLRNFRRRTDEWDFTPGEKLRVGIRNGVGQARQIKWHNGIVHAVYRRFIVVQLPKYKVTVSQWELKEGTIKIENISQQGTERIVYPPGGHSGVAGMPGE